MVEHLTFNQVVRGSSPRCFIDTFGILPNVVLFLYQFAVMAELADAADLGSVVFNVQVQVLLTAFRNASAVLIFKSAYFIRFRVFL